MLAQLIMSGISQGSIYALVALGMTVLFRATTIVNFAHGDLFMGGAFILFVALNVVGLPFLLAALISVIFMFFVGVAVERLLIRPMGNAPHVSLAMMTVALSFLLRGIAELFYGGQVLSLPPILSFPPVDVAGIIVTTQDIVITGITLVFVAVFFVFFQRTRIGRVAQAASANARGAALVGINVGRFYGMMWGISAALGAVAGILIAPITLLYPDMGAGVLIHAFAAMTLGGFGSFPGAVVGGLLIGVLEQLAGGYLSTSMIDMFAFLVIIVVLLIRPTGLFGYKEVQRV